MRAKSEAGQQPEPARHAEAVGAVAGVEAAKLSNAWRRHSHGLVPLTPRPSAATSLAPALAFSPPRAGLERRRARSWGGSQLGVSASARHRRGGGADA